MQVGNGGNNDEQVIEKCPGGGCTFGPVTFAPETSRGGSSSSSVRIGILRITMSWSIDINLRVAKLVMVDLAMPMAMVSTHL